MRKSMNVIQIKGIRGLLIAIFVVTCLAAGFIAFPGWLCMVIWNTIAGYAENMPAIGIFQGLLLWGIMIAAYFAFKKDRVIISFKTPEGLSEEELRNVFSDLKKQTQEDPILQAMLRARETELKIKNTEETNTDEEKESVTASDTKN